MERDRLGSRLGFLLLSAGCAIGCGNVWKFPWMTGENGGGAFVLVYILCLIVLGLPVVTMEFTLGRAAQTSPIGIHRKLEKEGQKWHWQGYLCLAGNICLMAFYTVVTGWIVRYFVKFLIGQHEDLSFASMIGNAKENVIYLGVVVVIAFIVLSFQIQGGLERVTKYIMIALFVLMIVLAVKCGTLSGAAEGYRFYLIPDFSKITPSVVTAAMNQAFFTLSVGIGSMAIFGSYINKDRALLGESVSVICFDTFVAIMAGLIIFPACYAYGTDVGAGPALLFDTMATVFTSLAGGRIWGTLFFLFMVFAAFSTVLAVCENIIAMVRELTGWSRKTGSLVCGIGIFCIALTTALGYSVFTFQPFAEGTAWLDFWDFIVSTNVLPLGSLLFVIFCTQKRFGFGWEKFMEEANQGKGLKVKNWMRPIFAYVVPVLIIVVYIIGLVNFDWK